MCYLKFRRYVESMRMTFMSIIIANSSNDLVPARGAISCKLFELKMFIQPRFYLYLNLKPSFIYSKDYNLFFH